ncbi:WD40/YVTN/BNR-like repeat-containing protein [Actinokineospora sp.]|uniref:WD40/YVTN/BNR-like repeat-containing protein n=1 Tax=Actinokineospora sp. TaxID=1872133 RepID=UPI0040378075
MPDLDRELGELRARLDVRRPELRDVLDRVRARRSRRRLQLGAVVAVVAVAAIIPVLRGPRATLPVTPPPAVVSPPVDTAPMDPTGPHELVLDSGRRAYVVHARCQARGCTQELRVSEDGRTWTTRALPVSEIPYPDGLTAEVRPLGPNRVVVDSLTVDTERSRWHSGDGGRTWTRIAAEVTGVIDHVPAGTLVEARCLGQEQQDCPRRVVATVPDTGERRELATQPPFEVVSVDPVPAGDGNWWVSGLVPGTDRWLVAVTRDQGRTWSAAPLPAVDGQVGGVTVAGWGPVMYAVAQGMLLGERSGLQAVFESTDGGGSWRRTWSGDGVRSPRTLAGTMIARRDGGLLAVSREGQQFRSGDGGRTFEPVAEGPALAWVRWTGGGYLSGGSGGGTSDYLRSPDGVNWSEVRIG